MVRAGQLTDGWWRFTPAKADILLGERQPGLYPMPMA